MLPAAYMLWCGWSPCHRQTEGDLLLRRVPPSPRPQYTAPHTRLRHLGRHKQRSHFYTAPTPASPVTSAGSMCTGREQSPAWWRGLCWHVVKVRPGWRAQDSRSCLGRHCQGPPIHRPGHSAAGLHRKQGALFCVSSYSFIEKIFLIVFSKKAMYCGSVSCVRSYSGSGGV